MRRRNRQPRRRRTTPPPFPDRFREHRAPVDAIHDHPSGRHVPPPEPGDLLWIDRPASVQFALAPFAFLLVRVHRWSTYTGWIWLDGFELSDEGRLVQRRSIFVQTAGIQPAPTSHPRPQPRDVMAAITWPKTEPTAPRRTR
ncbi:hypothetical protein GCM10009687_67990 [Asanoa iriomotensis]